MPECDAGHARAQQSGRQPRQAPASQPADQRRREAGIQQPADAMHGRDGTGRRQRQGEVQLQVGSHKGEHAGAQKAEQQRHA